MRTLAAFLVGGEVVNMIANSGPVGLTVIAILALFSVVSWAIIFSKWALLRRARAQSARFMRMFRKSQRLQDVAAVAEQFRPSPLVAVFDGAYNELRRQVGNPAGTVRNVNAVQRAMQVAASEELHRLERRMPWLATTAAASPFIGLFGTVWGIIDAFHSLGTSGAATLRAVAPGISEALIATAAGLFAAIPAVIAYNQFTSSLREQGLRIDDFALELLNAVERPPEAR